MFKKFFIFFIAIFLFSLTFVNAVPPVTTAQQFTDGYYIEIPQDNIIKVGQNYSFDFHIFNISNGHPITSGISCHFHLYDNKGVHIYQGMDTIVSEDYDYSFFLNNKNFTTPNHYYYNILCNSTNYGGYANSILIVTSTGAESSNPTSFFYAILISLLVIAIILSALIFFNYESFPIRVGMVGSVYISSVILSFTLWVMSTDYIGVDSFFTKASFIIFTILCILAMPLLIGSFLWYLFEFRKIKEIDNLISKGYTYDEADNRNRNNRRFKR